MPLKFVVRNVSLFMIYLLGRLNKACRLCVMIDVSVDAKVEGKRSNQKKLPRFSFSVLVSSVYSGWIVRFIG